MTEKLEAGGSKLDLPSPASGRGDGGEGAARRILTPPKQADAEPVCLLDKDWAKRRAEPPDAFLASARSQTTLPAGAEFRFEAAEGMWQRVATFVAEERECCPFFAFEQWDEKGEIVLRIIRPQQ